VSDPAPTRTRCGGGAGEGMTGGGHPSAAGGRARGGSGPAGPLALAGLGCCGEEGGDAAGGES
jgi:hypothetical protein